MQTSKFKSTLGTLYMNKSNLLEQKFVKFYRLSLCVLNFKGGVVLDSPKRCVEICHVWDVILTGCPNNLAFSRFFTLQVGFFAQTLINKFKNYVIFLTMCNIHKLHCRQRSSMNTKVGYLKTKLSKTVFYCLLL